LDRRSELVVDRELAKAAVADINSADYVLPLSLQELELTLADELCRIGLVDHPELAATLYGLVQGPAADEAHEQIHDVIGQVAELIDLDECAKYVETIERVLAHDMRPVVRSLGSQSYGIFGRLGRLSAEPQTVTVVLGFHNMSRENAAEYQRAVEMLIEQQLAHCTAFNLIKCDSVTATMWQDNPVRPSDETIGEACAWANAMAPLPPNEDPDVYDGLEWALDAGAFRGCCLRAKGEGEGRLVCVVLSCASQAQCQKSAAKDVQSLALYPPPSPLPALAHACVGLWWRVG
jgi:hypothetical protein